MTSWFSKKKGNNTPSTESSQAILDSNIDPEEAPFLNTQPLLPHSSSSGSLPTSSNSNTNTTKKEDTGDLLIDLEPAPAPIQNKPMASAAAVMSNDTTTATSTTPPAPAATTPDATSAKRRSFFGFGKKKAEPAAGSPTSAPTSAPSSTLPPTSTSPPPRASVDHQRRINSPNSMGSASPRLSVSDIFERDVQDPSAALPSSPAIPSHIATENHIPSVLETASIAITDPGMNPDHVEIVSTTTHHPVLAAPETYANPWADDSAHTGLSADDSAGYATGDTKRLSFISFADVVHAEHAEATQSSTNLSSPALSDHGALSNSPPMGISATIKDVMSGHGGGPGHHHGSISGASHPFDKERSGSVAQGVHSELTVQTLSQALRRPGSGDLKAATSSPKHHPITAVDENPWSDS